jgi:signal peptidase II
MTHARLALLGVAAIFLDQATKAAALSVLTPGLSVAVLPGFALTLDFNEGASFGMLSGVMAGRPWAMAALAGTITLVIAILAWRSRHPVEAAGLALIVGGSLGNIADRLRQGAVTDFLDVHWRDWHWPAFNLADVAITIGAALIVVSALPGLRKGHGHA